jgi:alkaline phosphatase D
MHGICHHDGMDNLIAHCRPTHLSNDSSRAQPKGGRVGFYFLRFAPLLALAACATTPPVATESAAPPASAQEALRPFYAGLKDRLPVAAPNPALAADTVLTRFAFGSCVNENRAMAFWDVIAAQKPQAFLMIGDNVYGDTRATWGADMPTLSASYRKLSARQEFDRFRRSIPMMTT